MLGKWSYTTCIHPPYNIYFFNNSTSSRKNEEQKKRVEKKNAALNVIRGLIINSSLISKDAKEERLTEVRETITLQHNKVELYFHTHVHTHTHIHTHTHTPHFNVTKLSYLSPLGVHTEVMFAAH